MTKVVIEPSIETHLRFLLETDPVEDGFTHPAEAALIELFQNSPDPTGDWVLGVLSNKNPVGTMQSDLLRLLGRQKPLSEEWRNRVIQLGLTSSHVEIRDAAVQAAESWEDAGNLHLLEEHQEPCPWLADYIFRVIKDSSS